jgi:radical SAM protein with 4Fe4S-binding SPASM domain
MATSLVDTTASVSEFIKQFGDRTEALRLPLMGMLEITSRCNLRCVHCYLGPQEEQHKKRASELSTSEVMAFVDQMVEAGTLYLTITGGDPMMRPDFPQIFRHAKERGLLVTVFCDGVLVTDRIVELFRELPPSLVEVSLYGATAETYEKVTRVPGSFAKCLAGIGRLRAAGLRIGLKSVLMTLNQHEMPAMEQMAQDWGIKFRYDSAIFPCLPNRSEAPLDLRVSPARAVEIEMSNPTRLQAMADYFETRQNVPGAPELYQCGAGLTSFYMDPFGDVSPCLMTTKYRYSARGQQGGFAARWRDDVSKIRTLKPENPDHGCGSCGVRAVCTGCSAFHALETGREDVKSEYVCETTQHRVKALRNELDRRKGRIFLRVLEAGR